LAAPARSSRAARHGAGRRAHGPRRGRPHRHARADEPPPAAQVDINAADAATLATIPGIGPGLAERIVAFRTSNGAFASVDELLDVSGITDRRLDALLPYVVAR
ncbi:MAG TPA: helix-hairpin-helix domain-containing protein, partial [Candidatus Elarobacter sp.]